MAHKLMVVSHPDEETLFGGARLAMQPHQWKVICVTNGDNGIRRKEFENVMQMTKSEYEIWNYPDREHDLLDEHHLRNDLHRAITEKYWDKILTHNENGEYGHLHNRQIHRVMKSIVNNIGVFRFGDQMHESLWFKKLVLLKHYISQSNFCMKLALMARSELISED
jgi:LmbE family N-acetylglucosaminyl deacetylase